MGGLQRSAKMINLFRSFIGKYRAPLVHEANIDQHLIVICVGREEVQARQLLQLFSTHISSIWPALYSTLEAGFDDYDHADEFPPDIFFFHASRMAPKFYMGDESDFRLRLEIDAEKFSNTLQIYDFFLDGELNFVHHQPVF